VLDFGSYMPTETAVEVHAWQRNGADICHRNSYRALADVQLDRDVLAAHGLPPGLVFFCERGERYADVIRRVGADVLVEDDCESIGGTSEMTGTSPTRAPGHAIRYSP
jgi:hypothetical protein